LTENAGRENDRQSKLQGMKLQDVKMTDQFAGHEIARHEITRQEIAGHENDRPKMTTGREWREKKYSFNRDNTTLNCANF